MSSAANSPITNRPIANHSRFAFQIPSLKDEIRVVSFRYRGALSAPYECELEVASLRRDLPLQDLLGKAAVLTLFDERHPRHIHGEMVGLSQGSIGRRFTSYRVILRPKIELLGKRSGMRIFQDKTPADIVTQVLKEAGIQGADVKWQLSGKPASREYCVQYRETDLAFISRLLEEEGLFYFFEHRLDGHTLVIADRNRAFHAMAGNAVLPYRPRSGLVSGEESVYEFHASQQLASGALELRDYGFEKPSVRLQAGKSASLFPELQHYRYPGHFRDNSQGKAYVQAQLLGHQAQRYQIQALSDCPRLAVGNRFSLSQHGTQGFNIEYLVTALRLEGKQPQVLEEGASEEGSSFAAQLEAIPASVEFKPLLQHPRPHVSGVQTAFVTGPKGEEIYTDRYGRVKVQFHWDREGKRDDASSCWLRTSQAWAGNQWGAMAIPRIGQEVIVSFVNGDPDQPLVTGALYNATTQPPYDLPAHKTRTTYKSQSSPGGGGYNELRMEDKKGSEQLFIHGQKDVDLYIKKDRLESIYKDRHRIVINAAHEKIGKDQNNKSASNRNIKIGQTLSQQVGGGLQQKTGQTWLEKTGADFSLKAGTSVVLDAGMSITLKAGSGTVALGPAGVSITGSQVRINSGGGAGSAKGAAPTAPKAPKAVDPGKPGSAVNGPGASARFKQQPVAFDKSKGKQADPAALAALEKTFKQGAASKSPSDSVSADSEHSPAVATAAVGVTAMAASLARVKQGDADPAGKVYTPEILQQRLSGRGMGGQMSRHNGTREQAAELKAMGVTGEDTVVDLDGLSREQKLDTVFDQTGYFISDQTAERLVQQVDSGADKLVITDAVNEGTSNAKQYISAQPEVKAYRETLEAAIKDPEGSAYGGGTGYVAGLSEGGRQVSNILTANNDKMPASLKDAAIEDLVVDAGAVLLSGAGVAAGVVKAKRAVGVSDDAAAMVHAGEVVPGKLTTAQRIAKLDFEGHAPIRHGGPNRVTDLQLEDRAVRGIDPASGTTFDAFNKFPDGSPKPHKVGRNATAFISDDALLQADDFARSSAQFRQNIATARTNGDIFVDPVEIPLRDVFGSNYQDYVRGVTRVGSKNNPTGYVPTDFTDGSLKAIYRLDQNGNVKLHTLYPNPKP